MIGTTENEYCLFFYTLFGYVHNASSSVCGRTRSVRVVRQMVRGIRVTLRKERVVDEGVRNKCKNKPAKIIEEYKIFLRPLGIHTAYRGKAFFFKKTLERTEKREKYSIT